MAFLWENTVEAWGLNWELWKLSSSCGRTPRQVLEDPYFRFNLNVMRRGLAFENYCNEQALNKGKG